MSIPSKLKQQLKAKAHQLKPVILIGNNGFTEAVSKEIERALTDHELIKIRIQSKDRALRQELFTQICVATHAELIQTIGLVGVVYRKNES